MNKNSFVVIFGSVARGDSHKNSDIDVLLIDCNIRDADLILDKYDLPGLPVNYIEYDFCQFEKYFRMGSLFLYHIFKQGFLLYGNEDLWAGYVENFKLKSSFCEEIDKIKSDIEIYKDISIFNGKFYLPLVNIFPMVKNYCIFSLANMGIFEFNKVECMKKMVASDDILSDFLLLQSFYDSSVRGLNVDLGVDPYSSEAGLLLQSVYEYVSKGKV
ncbi:nucleotidyltransferase domain-containing protein [Vibrio mytili]|uniref:Polymerase beta nucleotidyltransferase domain-containing protein n=1 Tax=Vibrio mytili TaxID=50718 RepID=A0A0C3I4T1_9VIBR|nr:nucleotidyltransferase domain-containing protein [Vibrio mytili]KIN09357.1 hypothetical protein SU60_20130 [Vibrio mytili]